MCHYQGAQRCQARAFLYCYCIARTRPVSIQRRWYGRNTSWAWVRLQLLVEGCPSWWYSLEGLSVHRPWIPFCWDPGVRGPCHQQITYRQGVLTSLWWGTAGVPHALYVYVHKSLQYCPPSILLEQPHCLDTFLVFLCRRLRLQIPWNRQSPFGGKISYPGSFSRLIHRLPFGCPETER